MLCFTSPTMNRFSPFLDTARNSRSWTWLMSWYSSIMISSNRAETSRAVGVGAPSSPQNSRMAQCSKSL